MSKCASCSLKGIVKSVLKWIDARIERPFDSLGMCPTLSLLFLFFPPLFLFYVANKNPVRVLRAFFFFFYFFFACFPLMVTHLWCVSFSIACDKMAVIQTGNSFIASCLTEPICLLISRVKHLLKNSYELVQVFFPPVFKWQFRWGLPGPHLHRDGNWIHYAPAIQQSIIEL